MNTVVPRKDRTTYVGARVPDGLLEKVDRIVDTTEEYSSRSDFILCALRDLTRHYDDLHTNGMDPIANMTKNSKVEILPIFCKIYIQHNADFLEYDFLYSTKIE